MAGTINKFTLIDEAKLRLGDLSGKWFGTDASEIYLGLLLDYVAGAEQSYTLNKLATGVYMYQVGAAASPVSVITTGASGAEFTAEAGVTYRLYCRGLKVNVTLGVATASSLTLTGLAVDFKEATAKFFEYLAGHWADRISESAGGRSKGPGDVAARLMLQAAHIRGPMGL